jgi:DNA-binding MarR family transcriptional regulator
MIKKNINASVIFHIIKLSETWKRNGDYITQEFGITTQQWFILLLLVKDPNILYFKLNPHEKPLMAKELAEALNVSRANVTNLLNILIKKKLVAQVEDSFDKRRKRLSLTDAGIRMVEKIEKVRNEYNKRLFAKFSKADKEAMIEFMNTCLMCMNNEALLK